MDMGDSNAFDDIEFQQFVEMFLQADGADFMARQLLECLEQWDQFHRVFVEQNECGEELVVVFPFDGEVEVSFASWDGDAECLAGFFEVLVESSCDMFDGGFLLTCDELCEGDALVVGRFWPVGGEVVENARVDECGRADAVVFPRSSQMDAIEVRVRFLDECVFQVGRVE